MVPITALDGDEALKFLMAHDRYCTIELPEYFNFDPVLEYAQATIGDKSLSECLAGELRPEDLQGVNRDFITNKDGHYGVRPLTLSNPFLYYIMARDICAEDAWANLKECFKIFASDERIKGCSIPRARIRPGREPFKNASNILNWWKSVEQASIEMSLRYRWMFVTDITDCFGHITPDAISHALARKGSPHETTENDALAVNLRLYFRSMQQGRNIGIPQGSVLFSFVAEIVLGYADLLLRLEIEKAQKDGHLSENLDFQLLRYVDDYRIFCNNRSDLEQITFLLQKVLEKLNFRMNASKTRVSDNVLTDSIKPDKLYSIFNTPVVSKLIVEHADGTRHRQTLYHFSGFQKHLLYIYEFAKQYPDSGQLITMLSDYSKRLTEYLSIEAPAYRLSFFEYRSQEVDLGIDWSFLDKEDKSEEEAKAKEDSPSQKEVEVPHKTGRVPTLHIRESLPALVAIAVQIALGNLRAAPHALRIVSQLLNDMRPHQAEKKQQLIRGVYERLIHIHNSAFLQVWLQNITHSSDTWGDDEDNQPYQMPLCRIAAGIKTDLWNNSWLLPELAADLPVMSIVDEEVQKRVGSVIHFKPKRQYADDDDEPDFSDPNIVAVF